jgi:hypothetical protein
VDREFSSKETKMKESILKPLGGILCAVGVGVIALALVNDRELNPTHVKGRGKYKQSYPGKGCDPNPCTKWNQVDCTVCPTSAAVLESYDVGMGYEDWMASCNDEEKGTCDYPKCINRKKTGESCPTMPLTSYRVQPATP